jgi:hypothetical protein
LKNISKKTSKQTEIAALIISLVYLKKMVLISPLYDYEKIIFDSLVTQNGNTRSNGKHLWIKKATGLVVSEFMLKFIA